MNWAAGSDAAPITFMDDLEYVLENIPKQSSLRFASRTTSLISNRIQQMVELAIAIRKRSEFDACERLLLRAIEFAASIKGLDDSSKASLAYAHHNLADFYSFQRHNRLADALNAYDQERRLIDDLTAKDESAGLITDSRRFWSKHNYGLALARNGDHGEAIPLIDQVLQIVEADPKIAAGYAQLSSSYTSLAELLIAQNQMVDADQVIRRCHRLSLELQTSDLMTEPLIARWLLSRGASLWVRTPDKQTRACRSNDDLPPNIEAVVVIDWYRGDQLPGPMEVAVLHNLQSLNSINLLQNPSQDGQLEDLIRSLAEISSLRSIHLNQSAVTLKSLAPLIGHPNLQRLAIYRTPAASDPTLGDFREQLEPCVVLANSGEVASAYLLHDGAKPLIEARTKHDKVVTIARNDDFPWQGFDVLEVTPDPQKPLHDTAIRQLMPTVDTLRRLNLRGRNDVSDASIDWLRKYQHLKLLDIRDTQMTAAGIEKLRRELPDCDVITP